MLDACAHWAFIKLFYGLRNALPGAAKAPDWTDETVRYFGSRSLTQLALFKAACEEFDGRPRLRQLAHRLADRLAESCPDLAPFPVFGAFRTDNV